MAQFGGKYFCHDVRVIRLPRHGASLPVSIAVSCAADRQILAKINKDGVFLEQLETEPAQFLPDVIDSHLNDDMTKIDLNQPMKDVLAQLSKLPVKSRVALSGSMIVARDLAHAKINQMLDEGKAMPEYMKNHAVYVIVDEAQSLERNVLLTVLSRIGKGSRVVLTHDVAQRDNLRVGRHDGVAAVVEKLKGHPLFAHVTLTRSERSPIAALVTDLLEDQPV